MAGDFKRGDHVEWNSEAGRVRGTIQKKARALRSAGFFVSTTGAQLQSDCVKPMKSGKVRLTRRRLLTHA
jgi:hypothetical protein